MAQVNFGKEEFYGELQFSLEISLEGSFERELTFSHLDEMNYYLNNFYAKNYKKLFEREDIHHVELIGISFKGIKDSERFSVNVTEDWNRATIIFNEKKFGDINVEKMNRIKKIIEE